MHLFLVFIESFLYLCTNPFYSFTMKKETYVVPQCEEIIIKIEDCVMSEGGGGNPWEGEEG